MYKRQDLGAEEIVKLIKPGQTELEIAIAGRDRMEREIAKSYPGAEYMDTWVWFSQELIQMERTILKRIEL